LKVVAHLDLNRFQGTWYEIGHNPWFPEKDCFAMIAHYKLSSDRKISVTNACRKNSFYGEISEINGTAWVVDSKNQAKWKVQFIWPFTLDYRVIDLGENYDYAIIGEPDRENLWILSQDPIMDKKLVSKIIERTKSKGYDLSRLILTPQDPLHSKCLARWIEEGMEEKREASVC
jgi:apolipoprotein D and lipocalin family protein